MILVLLLGGEDDDSMSGPASVSAPSESTVTDDVLPVGEARGAVVTAAPDVVADETPEQVAPVEGALDGLVRGRLIDGNGRPVADERVMLVLSTDDWREDYRSRIGPGDLLAVVRSDAEGRFAIEAGTGRRHLLVAGGERWPSRRVSNVVAGDDVLVALPDAYLLEGQVLEQETGAPVEGAQVFAVAGQMNSLRPPENLRVSGFTDAAGRFAVGPLPAEDVVVAAYAEGYGIAVEQEIAPVLGETRLMLPPARPLYGLVAERETEAPVAGARVRWALELMQPGESGSEGDDSWPPLVIAEREAVSDENGQFDLGLGPSIGFVLDVEAEGYVPQRSTRYLNRKVSDEGEIRVNLTPATLWTGVALNELDAVPAAGARVVATSDMGVISEGEVDAGGEWALSMAGWDGVGRVNISAEATDGRYARNRIRGRNEPLALRLSPPLQVEVTVVDGDTPLAGAELLAESNGALSTLARTDAEGTVELTHRIAVGWSGNAVKLTARLGGRVSLPAIVDLNEAEPGVPADPITIDLASGGVLAGRVVDSYGEPIAAASLRISNGPRCLSDEDGRFLLEPVALETAHRLSAWAEGFHSVTTHLPGGDRDVVIVLEPVVVFEGRALALATGMPMQGFTGSLLRLGSGDDDWNRVGNARIKRLSGGLGGFSVNLPGPGRFVVELKAKDFVPARSVPFDFNGTVQPAYQEIGLAAAAVLETFIVDSRGEPVSGLTVTATKLRADGRPDKSSRQSGRTGRDGAVRLNLRDGGTFQVSGGGKPALEDGLVVRGGYVVTRTYRLPATGGLEVRALGADGQPVTDVTVRIRSVKKVNAHNIYRRTRISGPQTFCLVEGLPEGPYTVQVSKRGLKQPRQPRVEVSAHRVQSVDTELLPPDVGATLFEISNIDAQSLRRLKKLGYVGGGR